MQIDASVVLPVRDGAAHLADAVASVLAQEGVTITEVVIAVGESTDNTAAVAARLAQNDPRVVAIANPTGEIAAGINLAVSKTTSPIIVRIDSRCRLDPTYVERAALTMHKRSAANVGAVQVPVGETSLQRAIAAALRSKAGSGNAPYREGAEERKVATAFLGVFDRAAFDLAGGFDERFRRNEDAELNVRLNQLDGWDGVWLDPSLTVPYLPRKTLGTLARQYFDYGWWRLQTIVKHPGSLQVRQLVAPAIVIALVVSAVLGLVVWWPIAAVVWVGYLLTLAVAALAADGVQSVFERLGVIAALAVMHISWGSAVLGSFVRNVVLGGSRRLR